ncbi:hypothetical protein AAU61_16035 [Desulfocarbo indianensis]|nr:hypothetical protein AAU61_16035 [Desulfocarbo indianensis]
MPEALKSWARENWPGGDPGSINWEPVAADGSARLFLRLTGRGQSLVAMSNPANPAENRAWHYLAGHLGGLGLPVARVLAADLERGLFLMEDLGRGSLQEAALAAAGPEQLASLYEPVLAMLARLQAKGGQGFDLSVCFDGPELTPAFLREREAGYFLEEFILGACGLGREGLPPGLDRDLDRLCQLAGGARPRGLVHRDFQSRNIVWQNGRLGLVDFQGARLGPAQYDLAALLYDPYVDLEPETRILLMERYLALRTQEGPFDREAFLQGWPYVAACRLMQALGAYAFLSRKRGRTHFALYAEPALDSLRRLCEEPALAGFQSLGGLLESLPGRLPPEAFRPLPEEKI